MAFLLAVQALGLRFYGFRALGFKVWRFSALGFWGPGAGLGFKRASGLGFGFGVWGWGLGMEYRISSFCRLWGVCLAAAPNPTK